MKKQTHLCGAVVLLGVVVCVLYEFISYLYSPVYTDGKRISSNMARDAMFEALAGNDSCLVLYNNSCDGKYDRPKFNFHFNFKYVTKIADDVFTYHEEIQDYKIYFVKKYDQWKCYTEKGEYPVVGCEKLN